MRIIFLQDSSLTRASESYPLNSNQAAESASPRRQLTPFAAVGTGRPTISPLIAMLGSSIGLVAGIAQARYVMSRQIIPLNSNMYVSRSLERVAPDSDSDDDYGLPDWAPQPVLLMSNLLALRRSLMADDGFSQIMNHLFASSVAQQDRPAALSIRQNLATMDAPKGEKCVVCMDEYESPTLADRQVVKLACDHHFHKECILSWLEKNNSCPTCRHLMESDNAEWNAQNRHLIEKAQEQLRKRKESAPTINDEGQESKRRKS